jgi:hypothetical protein
VICALDASMLILLFDPDASAPTDPANGEAVTLCQERLQYLLSTLAKTRGSRIIIPTPALAEFLVRTRPESAPEYVGQLQRLRGCRIAPFAERAAIEFSEMQRTVLHEGRRRPARGEIATRAKAKFDQQIVAIAKTEGAAIIYSDDRGLAAFAKRFDIETIGVAKLPLPPESLQGVLPLDPPEASPPESN